MAKKKEKSLLDKIKLNFSKLLIGSIILNVLFLLFGIFIYSNPTITLELTGIILGVYLILFGIYAIFEFIIRDQNPLFTLNILWGILSILAGLFVIINPFQVIKVLTFTLGIYLIIISINKIIDAIKLKKYHYDGWSLILTIAIILLIFGIFIMINPMASMDLVEATGIFIILASILEICASIMLYTKAKEILELFKK
mgnify:CR=1 FL=1